MDGGKGDQYVVDLDRHTCSCKKWDLSGIPCPHGIATVHYKCGKPVEEYVISRYRATTYLRTYDNLIQPINGPNLWVGLSMKLLSHLHTVDNQED